MPFDYIDASDAKTRDGLRMVVVRGVPSPWGEAAKGIFHIKELEWAAVALDAQDEALRAWTGSSSAPAAINNDEKPRTGWAEILLLAERLEPQPALLPSDPAERTLVFGLGHELLGEDGLAWARRLQLVAAGLKGEGGFQGPVAPYIGSKYGYTEETGARCGARVVSLLNMLSERLSAQKAAGSGFLVGHAVSAADIYFATTMAMFAPLSEDMCKMSSRTRAAFETFDAPTKAALDPALVAHRDMMYRDYLETPLSL